MQKIPMIVISLLACTWWSTALALVEPLEGVEHKPSPGLYQSTPFALEPGGPPVFRMFLKVYAGDEVSLVVSADPARDMDDALPAGSDEAGSERLILEGDAFVFRHGPTRHVVETVSVGQLRLRTQYADGRRREHLLDRVILSP